MCLPPLTFHVPTDTLIFSGLVNWSHLSQQRRLTGNGARRGEGEGGEREIEGGEGGKEGERES